MEHIIGFVNEGFANSGVKIKLFLHCVERYFGPEEENAFTSFAKYKVRNTNIKQMGTKLERCSLLVCSAIIGR